MNNTPERIITVTDLKTYLGNAWVHDGISLTVHQGEIFAIVGGSGSGKTTLLRSLLGLHKPTEGKITLFGKMIYDNNKNFFQHRFGVMFQKGALLTSLTVLENIAFPLREHTLLNDEMIEEIAMLKMTLVGLPANAAVKYPSELSGGMQKRASLARALAIDPELLFLDEPTAGLDPPGANDFDELILSLKTTLNLTMVMVTHDLETLWRIADRVAFLGHGKILGSGTMTELATMSEPVIFNYFNNPRSKIAQHLSEDF